MFLPNCKLSKHINNLLVMIYISRHFLTLSYKLVIFLTNPKRACILTISPDIVYTHNGRKLCYPTNNSIQQTIEN